MSETAMVKIPVSPRAAQILRNPRNRDHIGKLISDLLAPLSTAEDPLFALIAELKSEVHAAGLTDEAIDAELDAYNAEHRL